MQLNLEFAIAITRDNRGFFMWKYLFLLLFTGSIAVVWGHEGHHDVEEHLINWWDEVGKYHLVLLHFPIALINMVGVAEGLSLFSRRLIFELSARFMLVSAAVLIVPTAILGYVFSYSAPYEGAAQLLLNWHMWLGIATVAFTWVLAYLKEWGSSRGAYYSVLVLLLILVNSTCFVGGKMTFG